MPPVVAATLVVIPSEACPAPPGMQETEQHPRRRLYGALAVYAIIAVLAACTLEGMFRVVVWIFIGGLAVKTWIAWLQQQR